MDDLKPVLYAPGTVLFDQSGQPTTAFYTNGLGTLSDVISCYVEEERNGSYELEMKYPFDGIHFSDIRHSSIIKVKPYDNAGLQLFRVYKITSPLNKVCTIYAEHISYQLNYIPLMPFKAYDIQSALAGITQNMTEPCPFIFWSDIQSAAAYEQTEPEVVRARLGGQEGSFLDVYGGEYEWDNYTVKLHSQRGSDRDVTLRYGKNITDISQEESIATTYTGIVPFWIGEVIDDDAKERLEEEEEELETSIETLEDQIEAQTAKVNRAKTAYNNAKTKYGANSAQAKKKKKAWQNQKAILSNLKKAKEDSGVRLEEVEKEIDSVEGTKFEVCVTLPEQTLYAEDAESFPFQRIRPLDLSDKFEDRPSVADLRDMAKSWMDANDFGEPAINLKVSFLALWDTDEYKDIAPLERVQLCDTVVVEFERLNIRVAAKVTAYKYDVVLERYESITLGDAKKTLAGALADNHNLMLDVVEQIPRTSDMQAEIERATKLINGGYGGYVVFVPNANGQPEEILIMDQPDVSSAVNVIRMNKNGIGFSTSGYEGPFETAWTIDSHFVADFITAGTLTANIIKAGILGDVAGKNYWNMTTGEFKLTAASTKIGNETIEQYVEDHSTELTQENVFNALTQNGAKQGVIMDRSGDLYINASYIQGTTISGKNIIGQTTNTDTSYVKKRCVMSNGNFGIELYTSSQGWFEIGAVYVFQIDESVGSGQVSGGIGIYSKEDLYLGAGGVVTSDTIRNTSVGSSGKNVQVGSTGKLGYDGSSRRFKFDIVPIGESLDPKKLLDIEVVQFKFKPEYDEEESERYLHDLPGFIAEQVDECYPIAVDHSKDESGTTQCDTWNERYIIPPMLALIQEQHKEIQDLKAEVSELKNQMQEILTKIGG